MLFKLLALPVTLPAAGIRFCIQQVVNAAEAELLDPAPVKEELLLLQLKLEEGEIAEEEYVEREKVLFRRLREIREYRERQARQAREQATQQAIGAAVDKPRSAVIQIDAGADSPPTVAAPPLAGPPPRR